jgi:hypothetical protein
MASRLWIVRFRVSLATSAVVRSKYDALSSGRGGDAGSLESK